MEPGAPPTEGTGVATFRMILGGRYEVQEYSGSMMGMSFEGRSISGYDNARRTWFSSWVDSMGTGVLHSEGTEDANGVVSTVGTMTEPLGRQSQVRMVLADRDADTIVLEMFVVGAGAVGESKAMELTYKRRK